jgi:transposase
MSKQLLLYWFQPWTLTPASPKSWRSRSYQGSLGSRLQTIHDCVVEISQRLGSDFAVEPWHWVIERTFAWLENACCLCRDYEELPQHHEAFIYLTMTRLMLLRLTHNQLLF